jgi:hypothetical protein
LVRWVNISRAMARLSRRRMSFFDLPAASWRVA